MKTLAALFFLFGWLTTPAQAGEGHVERLLGLTTDFEAGQIIFTVASSGCTERGDFRIEFRNNTLTLYRLRTDTCKAMPQRIPLAYALTELGLSPHQGFAIGNHFIVNENLAQ
ncbi:MAG: hypothetical protein Kow0096_24840 [Thiohalomonadaceae bacterium]